MREKAWTVAPQYQYQFVRSLRDITETHTEALICLACQNAALRGTMLTRKEILQFVKISPRSLDRAFKALADRGIIVGYELAPNSE